VTALVLIAWSYSLYAQEVEREAYNDRYCTTCHGTDGRGNYGVQAPRLAGMEDWYLQRQLENFRAGIRGTHPQDIEGLAMQPMAAKLSDESIADNLAWVGEWPYVPAEPTIEGNANAGRGLYATCATCHGANGEGNEALGAPALAGQNDWYLVTQLKNFKAGYRGTHPQDTYGAQMRAMANTLNNDAAIMNVVSYINTLGK
ncbi:MAG: c-type cytochrome, partial [Gammaproteobacteria bacterium]